MPNSLFWFNRREYYRVNTPIMNPSTCEIVLPKPAEDSSLDCALAYETATHVIRKKLADKIQEDLVAEQQAFMKAYTKMSVENKIKAKLERQALEEERKINPVLPDENLVGTLILNLHDLSLSGMSIMNHNEVFSPFLTPRTVYKNCKLNMPENGSTLVSFEIMMKRRVEAHKLGDFDELVGVRFIEMKPTTESTVLHYIQEIERQSGVLNI